MTTWAQWRKAAKTPFKDGERVRMEGGKAYKARVQNKRLVQVTQSKKGSAAKAR